MRTLITSIFSLCTFCVSAQKKEPQVLISEANVESAYPRLSKDGKSILYQSNKGGKWQLLIHDIVTKKTRQLTNDAANNNFPDWSYNNEWIAYVSDKDGNEEIYLMDKNGKNVKRLTNDPARDIHPYFSPDGKYLLFNSTRGNGSLDIYRITLANGKTERLTNTEQNETCARYSPDMKHVVFLRNDDLSDDVYVMNISNFLTTNITKDPSVRDGWPVFGPDGNWIYYSSMQKGPFCVFRIDKDGKNKQQLTQAALGEEDASVFVANDGRSFIYNKRHADRIDILRLVI
jgi:TolB protein